MHELDMEILIVFLSFIPLFLFYEFYSLNKEMHNEIKCAFEWAGCLH
jgi:hypothetical protein